MTRNLRVGHPQSTMGKHSDRAGVGDGGAFEENAVDDGGADADLCDSM